MHAELVPPGNVVGPLQLVLTSPHLTQQVHGVSFILVSGASYWPRPSPEGLNPSETNLILFLIAKVSSMQLMSLPSSKVASESLLFRITETIGDVSFLTPVLFHINFLSYNLWTATTNVDIWLTSIIFPCLLRIIDSVPFHYFFLVLCVSYQLKQCRLQHPESARYLPSGAFSL